jgi:hypothetical protein
VVRLQYWLLSLRSLPRNGSIRHNIMKYIL